MSLQVLSRLVGPVSVAGPALIILSQTLNLALGLAWVPNWRIAQSTPSRYGLALFALYRPILALAQASTSGKPTRAGKVGPCRFPHRISGHAAHRRRLVVREFHCAADCCSRAGGHVRRRRWLDGRRRGRDVRAVRCRLDHVRCRRLRANVFPRPAAALLIVGGLVGILAGGAPVPGTARHCRRLDRGFADAVRPDQRLRVSANPGGIVRSSECGQVASGPALRGSMTIPARMVSGSRRQLAEEGSTWPPGYRGEKQLGGQMDPSAHGAML